MKDAIVFSGFTKKYGGFTAVHPMDLAVKKGCITGFVGKNGAGKSTTLRTLMNMVLPTAGSIRVLGLDSVQDAREIRRHVSYMPSSGALYGSLTPAELFRLCRKVNGGDYERALSLAAFFELDVHKKISSLSLGNSKKVFIVEALMRETEIFVMDEPTSGLDPLMQEKFFEKLLERKKQGGTVFLSSHNLSEIQRYCDRAVIIKDGKIVDNIDMQAAVRSAGQMVSYITTTGEHRTFSYQGDANALIARLAALDLQSVSIRPASIEETFIHYYADEEGEGQGA